METNSNSNIEIINNKIKQMFQDMVLVLWSNYNSIKENYELVNNNIRPYKKLYKETFEIYDKISKLIKNWEIKSLNGLTFAIDLWEEIDDETLAAKFAIFDYLLINVSIDFMKFYATKTTGLPTDLFGVFNKQTFFKYNENYQWRSTLNAELRSKQVVLFEWDDSNKVWRQLEDEYNNFMLYFIEERYKKGNSINFIIVWEGQREMLQGYSIFYI